MFKQKEMRLKYIIGFIILKKKNYIVKVKVENINN